MLVPPHTTCECRPLAVVMRQVQRAAHDGHSVGAQLVQDCGRVRITPPLNPVIAPHKRQVATTEGPPNVAGTLQRKTLHGYASL